MKKIITLLLFFVSTAIYSQDRIVTFTEIRTGKEIKQGIINVEVDDGSSELRKAPIKAKTLLGVINYFKEQGYKVDVKLGTRGAMSTTVTVYHLFLYKLDK